MKDLIKSYQTQTARQLFALWELSVRVGHYRHQTKHIAPILIPPNSQFPIHIHTTLHLTHLKLPHLFSSLGVCPPFFLPTNPSNSHPSFVQESVQDPVVAGSCLFLNYSTNQPRNSDWGGNRESLRRKAFFHPTKWRTSTPRYASSALIFIIASLRSFTGSFIALLRHSLTMFCSRTCTLCWVRLYNDLASYYSQTLTTTYIGNDPEYDSDKEPAPPTKAVDGPNARAGKRNAPKEAPGAPAAGGRGGRRGGGATGSESGRDSMMLIS